MKELFKFKQFEIDQTGCTMKINTDGVLLAVKAKGTNVDRILDIGTGTGVIALMLAQRFPDALVEAIDIDNGAFDCAKHNFERSPFTARLAIHHQGIENLVSSNTFDLIVSNPPFFINSLKNSDERKTLSRHASIHFYEALFSKCFDLLNANGIFQIIWPLEIRDQVLHIALAANLYLNEEICISSFPDSNPFRVISSFDKTPPDAYKSETFHIYEKQGVYSKSYLALLKPFFLKY